jgi:rhamnose utilization protein RhaD (predicted bifunctional aldolase and dehydrogenase)
MNSNVHSLSLVQLARLRLLTARIGANPLLTQASSGNSSIKLGRVLWIKASGKWMVDAMRDDIFLPLYLAEVTEGCLRRDLDPSRRYPGASVETAMHAVLPHRVVVHVHSVNTIAWAIRQDAAVQFQQKLDGIPWQWVPYVASGLPLARAIEQAHSAQPDTNVFVLGNHGLVIGGESCNAVEDLLLEVERRLAVSPRQTHPADYSALEELCRGSRWELPDDDEIHALATDPVCRSILSGGVLYPCQAIFSNQQYLIVDGRGVLITASMTPAELAMLSGLAQVITRVDAHAPIRYLTEADLETTESLAGTRYRALANARRSLWLSNPIPNRDRKEASG